MTGTCLFVYGFNDAENRCGRSVTTIVTIILGGLLLIAFPFIESKAKEPAVPVSIMHNPHVLVPLTVFMFVGGGW